MLEPADGEKQKQQLALKACRLLPLLHPLQCSSSATEKVSTMHLSLARLQLQQYEAEPAPDNCISHWKCL